MELKELHKKLDKHLEEQKNNWKHLIYAGGKYYQSLKEIGIDGKRSTEDRFEDYEIKKYLKKDMTTLDIGANTGFFSIYISKFVLRCFCVEINPYLCNIGKDVAKYLKRNVKFLNMDFKYFLENDLNMGFDIVMSFAADEVADRITNLSFKEYIDGIYDLIRGNGMLFFESQAEDILFNKFDKKFDYIKTKFDIIFQKDIYSTYPTKVKNRIFLVGVKKVK